ncbi:MAG: glutathione S-transferase family protein [Alphaproteobacteria bacterium]|nr:glutathione S-transferase family protein [Alphaproteobacteria bacterium]
MLKIFGRPNSANVQKVLWTCAELDLPYERIDAGLEYGVNDTPQYRAMNPMGLVPTIVDDGFVLWESNACVRYLAAKHGFGTLCPADLRVRADAERWMDWAHTLTFTISPMFWGLVRTPPGRRDLGLIEEKRREVARLFAMLDANLKTRDYVAGDRLTIGDIPFAAHVYRWFNLAIERPDLPYLKAWYERLVAREPYRKIVMIPIT